MPRTQGDAEEGPALGGGCGSFFTSCFCFARLLARFVLCYFFYFFGGTVGTVGTGISGSRSAPKAFAGTAGACGATGRRRS